MVIIGEKLLEIDPDQLFKENSVAELQNVQKSIQLEIEQKREELRSTVGERYRDLLKAADTITDMKTTAESVLECINKVNSLCQILQEKHLIGFKSNDDQNNPRGKLAQDDISRVVEIKLLLNLSDRIWTSIDEKKFVQSAELCLFASYIYSDLEASKIIIKYPIINNLWSSLKMCRIAIFDSARSELNYIILTPLESSDCLKCLMFMDPKYLKLNETLNEYLNLRRDTFFYNINSDEYPTVKDKLRASVFLVQHTLLVSCSCFIDHDGKENSINKNCLLLYYPEGVPTITKFPPVSPLAEKYLSATVKSFKLTTAHKVQAISAHDIKIRLQDWLEKIQIGFENEMVNLLGLVGNLKGLVNIRDRVSGVNNPSDWDVVESIIGPSNIYTLLVEPHIKKRTIQLVSQILEESFSTLYTSLCDIDAELSKNTKDIANQSEVNIKWFIWKETATDEVALQTRGCTPRVKQLCVKLDEQLQILHDDIACFCENSSQAHPLLEFINTCSHQTLQRFIDKLMENAAKANLSEASLIVPARMLQAMTTQCKNLKKCFLPLENKILDGGKSWAEISTMLHSSSSKIWRLWKEMITPQIRSLVNEKLNPDVSVTTLLLSKPASEVVTITEEAEENQSVTSQLRVPSQPSFTLQELLLQVCLRLNSVAVHTLPREIHLEIIETVASLILNHYDKLSSNDEIYQTHAWQLLLDVRFLTLLLLSPENQSLSQKLCKRLEETIDFIDLNVLYPYLQANVKKSAIRLQGTFGVLVDHNEKLAVLNSLKVASGQPNSNIPEEPNVLALASSVAWFPLLPISSGEVKKKEESPSKQRKQRIKEGKKKESASADFVKSAGAFFGAMTGGWS